MNVFQGHDFDGVLDTGSDVFHRRTRTQLDRGVLDTQELSVPVLAINPNVPMYLALASYPQPMRAYFMF
jgi:hypothetical protein